MRILCLAVITPDFPQLLTKFNDQVAALRGINPDTHAVAIGRPGPTRGKTDAFRYIRLDWNKARYLAAADAVAQTLQPDVIYFRYPSGDEPLYKFMRRHANVVLEHNTIEEDEYEGQLLADEKRWGPPSLALAAGLVGVTGEILEHERGRAGTSLPGWVMGNGIDPDTVPPLDFQLADDAVHMLCAARFAPWHGLDRLFAAMADYRGPQRLVLHLAGDGDSLPGYHDEVRRLGIAPMVRFHGHLDAAALDALTAHCHVGVGSLALQRKNLRESASLKHRQYCLQGLPFFYAGEDVEFLPRPDFVHQFDLSDAPLDLAPVLDLARKTSPAMRKAMRDYGVERLSWQAKAPAMLDMLRRCVEQRPPRVRVDVAPCGGAHQVSAVIVCPPGRGAELGVTIQSVREQVFRHVTDAVLDTVVVLPQALLSRDPAVRWVEDGDLSDGTALHAGGIAAAQGQWILPLLAGDEVRADLVDTLLTGLRHQPDLNALSARGQDRQGQPTAPASLPGLTAEAALPGITLFRKSLWEDADTDSFSPWPMPDQHFRLAVLAGALLERKLPRVCVTRAVPFPVCHAAEARAFTLTRLQRIFPADALLAAHDELRGMSAETAQRLAALGMAHPRRWEIHFWEGLRLEGQGDAAGALHAHSRATKLCPEDEWQPWLRLYLLYRAFQQPDKAAACLTACAKKDFRLRLYAQYIRTPESGAKQN